MRISIIAFSLTGLALAERLEHALSKLNTVSVYAKSKYVENSISESLNQWAEARFQDSDALIFVSSCGIAVRAIAPFVKSKKTDPAVIVIDELGNHAVSLLSGHIGGANELAETVAEISGAKAVITTATDIHGRMAPDVFAKKNNLTITDFTRAKDFAALIIQGRENEMEMRISPFAREPEDEEKELWLIPKWGYVGIGCRRGTEAVAIRSVYREALASANLDPRAIRGFASVSVKADEEGMLEFAESESTDISFFTPEELEKVPGQFTESDFVRKTIGVGNVCERSAMALAYAGDEKSPEKQNPYFAVRKYARDGVTVAIVIKEEELKYE